MGARVSSSAGVLQYDAVPDPSHSVLSQRQGRALEPEPEPPEPRRKTDRQEQRPPPLDEELQRLQKELQQARSAAQNATRKLARQEERPELILARQAVASQQTSERAPWEHADWARSQIKRIYEEHRPEKLPSIDALMKAWHGAEEELLAQIQAKYQPNSESVVVRKLKHQVMRLRDERDSVQRELEQRTTKLVEEKVSLEQGWNSALKTLELERAEHNESIQSLQAQIKDANAARSVEFETLQSRLDNSEGDTDTTTTSMSERDLETEILKLQKDLQETQAQVVLARREKVDAEVKAIAMRQSVQRNKERFAPPQQNRQSSVRCRRARARPGQYKLIQTLASDSVKRGDADRRRAETDERIETQRRQLNSRWAQSWVTPTNDEGMSTGHQQRQRWRPSVGVKNEDSRGRSGRLHSASRVPQRALLGTYRGVSWAQSWQDMETDRNQPDASERVDIRKTNTQSERNSIDAENDAASATFSASRPSSSDIMLRWAMQEQVQCLLPTLTAIPFN